jgi:hypothetical protein
MTTFTLFISVLLFTQINQPSKYLIDLENRTVAGIRVDDSIEQIRKKFGRANVKRIVEEEEDHPVEAYIISIEGYAFTKHSWGFSVDDSIFRTKEGLGVGSRVADFAKYYPDIVPSDREIEFISFTSSDERTQFKVNVGEECYRRLSNGEIPGDCIVKEIYF